MIDSLAEQMGFTKDADIYVHESGMGVRFYDHEAVITERLILDDEYNKITTLTYAAGELEESFLSTDGKGFYYLPKEMTDEHLRLVLVHMYAPLAIVIRPIKVHKVRYDPNVQADDAIKKVLDVESKLHFANPDVKFLGKDKNAYVYTVTGFDVGFSTNEKTESLVDMFNREPYNDLEEIVMAELKKTFPESNQQQAYNTLLHEASRLVDPPGE